MPAKPITLGSLHFSKRGDAATYLKSMLRKYDIGDRVSLEDEVILKAALMHHPDAITKIGCGVSCFSVRSADYGTKCFWVNRPDGTTEKFSVNACVYNN